MEDTARLSIEVDGRLWFRRFVRLCLIYVKFTHLLTPCDAQLQLEVTRLPSRNLGRDDRVISSHGKETRHPFLSLSVVHFVTQLPVHHKLDPRTGLGLGDKLLLRLAVRKLGLGEASERKKKAMQFGSHSARMHGEKKGDAILE